MEAGRQTDGDRSGPAKGQFVWWRFAFWLPACMVIGGPVAWAADMAQTDYNFAPLVIFPLLVGVGLGAMLVGLMRLGQIGHRPTVLLGTVLASLVAIAGQHYLGYRTECLLATQQSETFRKAQLEYPGLVKGEGPRPPDHMLAYLQAQARRGRDIKIGGYVARGWVAWLTWAVDALLVVAATSAMVIPAMRQPYCNRCRSWYRVTRSGRIDVETARRLAELAKVSSPEHPASARYRLLSCQGRCGPNALSLSWQQSAGGTSSIQAWIDAECRGRMIQALDAAQAAGSGQ